ncbi:hypothetical protein [Nonomuraea sp. NPDC049784]|uniref:hypothetical protein n=1 Tax=Nonomuraea sp. NPDC049784 TaxID=3154361 RepID=UPI0033DAEB4E
MSILRNGTLPPVEFDGEPTWPTTPGGSGPVPCERARERDDRCILATPPHETTVERYRQLADAGIDLVITGTTPNEPAILCHSLACADTVGLGVLVASDPRIDVLMRDLDVDERQTRALISRVIDDYEGYGSFRGISLMDEPYPDRFPPPGDRRLRGTVARPSRLRQPLPQPRHRLLRRLRGRLPVGGPTLRALLRPLSLPVLG